MGKQSALHKNKVFAQKSKILNKNDEKISSAADTACPTRATSKGKSTAQRI